MATVRDDFYHLVPDAVVLKRLGQRPMLRCCCCGEQYPRGSFKCCAPPPGMRSDYWLELACPMPANGGCGKCARHCQCPRKAERMKPGPLADLAKSFLERFNR